MVKAEDEKRQMGGDNIDWTDASRDWKALAWQYRDEIIRLKGEIKQLAKQRDYYQDAWREAQKEIEKLEDWQRVVHMDNAALRARLKGDDDERGRRSVGKGRRD